MRRSRVNWFWRQDGGRGRHELEESGIGQNGDKRRGQGGVVNVRPDEARMQRHLGKYKGEFTYLRETNADPQRGLRGITKKTNH